ncbi:MAG TPA: HEAT repeat domain-containing protein [Candidatus Hydrogenedentes bacterium]|nr:HEAT repeat domain-containing protein [Candidatus Hydrogenedentota bacterium]
MKRLFFATLAMLFAGAMFCATAEIEILGSDRPVSLEEIAGTTTLITVTFKDSGARDNNLKLLETHPDRIIVYTSKGEIIPYLKESIESITLQDGTVERRRFPEMESQVLRAEHQRVVDRAWTRIREVYNEANDDQQLRIHAAVCMALINDADAHNYLRQLAESNDIITQLEAAGALYLAGDIIPEVLLKQGLESGNRNARAMAASLAGLTEFEQGVEYLNTLFQDRAVQLSTPATRALARLGQTKIIPRVLDMLGELHEDKGEAAIFALTKLADEQVIEKLKFKLLEADGIMRFRIVRILHNLGDPLGEDELRYIYKNFPTLTPEVALLLAKDGDWEATQYLRNRLARREDPTIPNLQYRARNAQALLESGDPSAMAVFQELLRSDEPEVYRFVFELMVELGNPRLITLLQPGVETINKDFAFGACQTVIALAHASFRERLLLYREEFDY